MRVKYRELVIQEVCFAIRECWRKQIRVSPLFLFLNWTYIILSMQINYKAKIFGENLNPKSNVIIYEYLNYALIVHYSIMTVLRPRQLRGRGGLNPSVTERDEHLLSINCAPGLCRAHNRHVLVLCNSALTQGHPFQCLCWVPPLSRPIASFWKSNWRGRVLLFSQDMEGGRMQCECYTKFYFLFFHLYLLHNVNVLV